MAMLMYGTGSLGRIVFQLGVTHCEHADSDDAGTEAIEQDQEQRVLEHLLLALCRVKWFNHDPFLHGQENG